MSARACAALACALIVCGVAAPAAAQSSDERARALLGLARVKRDAGEADAARRYFEEAATIRPFQPQEREEYFWVLAGADANAAIATGRAILADTPGRGPVRDRLIGLYVPQRNEAAIVALAVEGERIEAGVALWPRRLGQSALRSGKADEALAAFERALRRTGSTREDEDGRRSAMALREQASEQAHAQAKHTRDQVERQIQRNDPRVSIERAVAAGQHSAARALIAKLPAATANQPAMRRLAGQLALWTGNPAEAIVILEDVLEHAPADEAAQTSLVDAYRAVGRTKEGWAMAQPLSQQTEAADRLLAYAELALEAGKPDAVPALVARVPQSAAVNVARSRLIARWQLAAGRPADAFKSLEALNPADLDAPAALALLDSAIAISGHAGALVSARRITTSGAPAWRDVVARQYAIEAIAGDVKRARANRVALAGWDSRAAAAADDEIVWALARSFASAPTPETRVRISAIATALPDHANAALLLARTCASTGDHQGALAALGPANKWNQLSIDARRVAADSLRALGRPREAIDVLADTAVTPGDAALLAELHATIGRDELSSGRRDAARASAERAVALDPKRTDVWIMLAELAATDGADALARLTDRGAPSEAVVAFHLARARAFAAADEWDAALGSIDALLRVDADSATALRLRAEVLSWSGRHAESLAAYDAYLSKQPEDLDAARQQARVYGWAGQFGESKRRYARLIERHPGVSVVAAEADAKTAFFDGRWSSAVEAYGRWLAIEPDNGEAAFERAESLRAAGRVPEADAALRALASSTNHQLAGQAWNRVQMSRRPAVSALTDAKSTNGYNGRRLLDVQGAGASFDMTARQGALATGVQTSYVRLSGGDASRRGYRVGTAMTFDSSASVKLRGRATAWSLDGVGVMPEYLARVDWRLVDRWTIGAGSDRSLLLENLETVDRKLAATGMFAAARFESPASTFDANVGWHQLSDDNRRARATVSYDRWLSERLPELRMLVWAEALTFENSAADYYSPARQIRVDAGLQYTREFRALKFRQDLKKRLSAGYLIGTDRDGVVYHHPTVNLTMEFMNGLALVARGDWIRSDVYNERSISIGLTITPGRR